MRRITLSHTTFPDPVPVCIWKDIKRFCAQSNTYHPQHAALISALEKRYDVPGGSVVLAAGTGEILQAFARAYGSHTFIFTPTHRAYMDGQKYGGAVTKVGSLEFGNYDIQYENRPRASLFFLANPNNPVGLTPKETVLKLVTNNPQSVIVVDEAYGDFAHQSVLREVVRHRNLVVCRSFSFGFGMAGARIGFFVAHPDIISTISVFMNQNSVSYLSVGAALSALSHENYFIIKRQEIMARRDAFSEFLAHHNFPVIPSTIPCVFIKYKNEKLGDQLATYLGRSGIIVLNGNGDSIVGLDCSGIRIGIGSEREMNTVKTVMARYARIEKKRSVG